MQEDGDQRRAPAGRGQQRSAQGAGTGRGCAPLAFVLCHCEPLPLRCSFSAPGSLRGAREGALGACMGNFLVRDAVLGLASPSLPFAPGLARCKVSLVPDHRGPPGFSAGGILIPLGAAHRPRPCTVATHGADPSRGAAQAPSAGGSGSEASAQPEPGRPGVPGAGDIATALPGARAPRPPGGRLGPLI